MEKVTILDPYTFTCKGFGLSLGHAIPLLEGSYKAWFTQHPKPKNRFCANNMAKVEKLVTYKYIGRLNIALVGICVSQKPKLQLTYLQVSSPHFNATLPVKTMILLNPSKDHSTFYSLRDNPNEPPLVFKSSCIRSTRLKLCLT